MLEFVILILLLGLSMQTLNLASWCAECFELEEAMRSEAKAVAASSCLCLTPLHERRHRHQKPLPWKEAMSHRKVLSFTSHRRQSECLLGMFAAHRAQEASE